MILNKLKKLKVNKSPGPDRIHPRVLHEIARGIVKPLKIILTNSLELMEIPKEWKHANVSAIHEKGPKTKPQNYRIEREREIKIRENGLYVLIWPMKILQLAYL